MQRPGPFFACQPRGVAPLDRLYDHLAAGGAVDAAIAALIQALEDAD